MKDSVQYQDCPIDDSILYVRTVCSLTAGAVEESFVYYQYILLHRADLSRDGTGFFPTPRVLFYHPFL